MLNYNKIVNFVKAEIVPLCEDSRETEPRPALGGTRNDNMSLITVIYFAAGLMLSV